MAPRRTFMLLDARQELRSAFFNEAFNGDIDLNWGKLGRER